MGGPGIHFSLLSIFLDAERLLAVSGSDGQRWLMEVPYLMLLPIWNLDGQVSIADAVKIKISSLTITTNLNFLSLDFLAMFVIFQGHFRNNMEVPIDDESELLVELTLGRLLLILINIDDSPSLVYLSISILNNKVSIFSINTSLNCKDLSFFIDNSSIFVSEHYHHLDVMLVTALRFDELPFP